MPAGTDSQVLKRLAEWEQEEALPELLEFYRKLLRIQSGAGFRIDKPKSGGDCGVSIARIARGLPLLAFDDLSIDWPLLASTFGQVVSLLASYPVLFGEVPEKLRELGSGSGLLKEATRAWFERNSLPDIAADGINQPVLELAIQSALRPCLVGHSEVLAGVVAQEQWRRGYCPVCGGSPDFAFLDRESGARWLVCSRCDVEWLFQRLECPYCGNRDHSKLAYFTDDKELYRLYVCESCRRYLKAIDLRRSESGVLLPLERYLTLHLDVQARENGYLPDGRRGRLTAETSPNGSTA